MAASRGGLLQGFGAVAIGAAAGTAAHGFMYERHHIEVTERTLDVAGWPSALAGLRIGFLTDLHRSSTVSHEMIAGAVDLVMARQPDLVIIGGDYVTNHDRRYVAAGGGRARRGSPRRTASSPCSATTTTNATCRRRCRRAGFTVLRDARTQITVRGEPVDIAGHSLLDAPRCPTSRGWSAAPRRR